MKGRRAPGILLLLLMGCLAAAQALADVRASLDASRIASGDTVQLTLEHDGRASGQPDLTALRQDFDILGTSSSTTFELFNGSASEKTEVVLTLAPKVTGHLTIPPLSWDGERSQPLSLDVTGPGSAGQPSGGSAPAAAKVFIETSASPDQPYVEAAVRLTVRLYTAETLYHADLGLPDSSDVIAKRLGSDEDSEAERNGQTYHVVTRQYLLFPLHSGKLTLPTPMLDAEVVVRQPSPSGNDPFGNPFGGAPFGGMFQTLRPVRVYGNPIVLSVRPRPAGAVGSYWLPADDLTLSGAWNPARLSAQAGDPVTLDLDLQATGLAAAQLPDVASLLTLPPGLKAYPDQPKLDDSTRDGKLIGSRDQTLALIADSPGRYAIPALTVKWWDTQANQARTTTLPARTLVILPAPAGSSSSSTASSAAAAAAGTAGEGSPPVPTAPPAQGSSPGSTTRSRPPLVASQHKPPPAAQNAASAHSPSEWEWISIGLAVIWLSTVGAWLWSRRSRAASRPAAAASAAAATANSAAPAAASTNPRQHRLDPAKERAAFRAACEADDPHAARAHLLAWATARWGTAPAGINAIGARIGDTAVAELLRDLDRACYAGGAWHGQALATALTELPPTPANSARQRDGLAPLYP